MILGTVKSKNDVSIRLTLERWNHITNSHLEIDSKNYQKVLNVIKNPKLILKGDVGEILAAKKEPGRNKWLVVAYKELKEDGFVITAYLTTDSQWLFKKETVWKKE